MCKCGLPAGLDGTCGSLTCRMNANSAAHNLYNAMMGFTGPVVRTGEAPAPVPYIDRLKERQAKFIAEIHIRQRELATLTALIQFLTERPEITDVAAKVMEP